MGLAEDAKRHRRSTGPQTCAHVHLLRDDDIADELREALLDHDAPFYGIVKELEKRGYEPPPTFWMSRHRHRHCVSCVEAGWI